MGGVRVIRVKRLSALARARLGYAAGVAAAAAGAGVQWGLGVGLIVGGVVTAASFLLLADVADSDGGGQR